MQEMNWDGIKNRLPLRKRWQRIAFGVLIIFHVAMIIVRDTYGDTHDIRLVVVFGYVLLFVVFLLTYLKYPNKFKD